MSYPLVEPIVDKFYSPIESLKNVYIIYIFYNNLLNDVHKTYNCTQVIHKL